MKHLKSMRTKSDDGWLDLATKSKKDNVEQLKALREDLEKAYKRYRRLILDFKSDLPKSKLKDHKEILIDYYEHPPADLSAKLKARRNDHGLNECPSCGNPLSPDTLDHFIPKDALPEFSILPNNLVPQCKHCAPKKSSRYYCDVDKSALFIHPIYFDLLSKIGFRVKAQMKGNKPAFEVEFVKTDDLSECEIVRIKKHLSELDVKPRFIAYCVKQYAHWKRKIQATRFDIRDALNQRIREQPNEGNFSRDWETAFCKGVLSCDAMVTYLNKLAPKEHFINDVEVEVIDL